MKIRRIQFIIRIAGIVLFFATMLCLTIIDIGFANYRIITSTIEKTSPQMSTLFPVARTQSFDNSWRIVDEPVYFTSRMSTMYDTATVRLSYRNDCCQSIIVGMQVGAGWDYQQELLHNNDFNNLSWDDYDFDGLTLWSREPIESELSEVLQGFDEDTKVASYNVSVDSLPIFDDYVDSRSAIDRSLNIIGPYSMLVYVADDLVIDFVFSDLLENFNINVYDIGGNRIFVENINNSDHSLKIINLVEGIYRITVDAPLDLITKSISSKHKYINFINQLSFVDGSYSLVTNASILRWQANNSAGLQKVIAADEVLDLKIIGYKYFHRKLGDITYLQIPEGNVSIFSDGLLSFDDKYLFSSIPGKVSRINDASDYDYLIAQYKKPLESNGRYISEVSFDLSKATISQGKLRFMIGALGVDTDNSLLIESIEVIYEKKSDQLSLWSEFIQYLKYWWVYVL